MAAPAPLEKQQAHVVVVGGGLAGLSAAICAAKAGARVTLLEKEKAVGGNSAKATSGMNAVGTAAQKAANISDTAISFFADTIESGHGFSDPALVRTLAVHSGSAVTWLNEEAGVDLRAVVLAGGHSAPRTHHEGIRPDGKPAPVGWDIMAGLRKRVESMPESITLLTGCTVTSLLQDSHKAGPDGSPVANDQHRTMARGEHPITGVAFVKTGAADAQELLADAVVLTTGGFGADHSATSLLAKYAPQFASLPTTNGAFATGDGVKLAVNAGAALQHMEFVQVHPTGMVDPANPSATTVFLGPEALRGVGGVLLNQAGNRFVNELGRRDDVSAAMYKWCATPGEGVGDIPGVRDAGATGVAPRPVHGFLVLTEPAAKAFGPNFGFYHRVKGFFKQVAGPAGVAAEIVSHIGGADKTGAATAEGVAAALADYAAAAAGAHADAFGKRAFPDPFALDVSPGSASTFFVARVTPAIHYCMGGVAMNGAAELLHAAPHTAEDHLAARKHAIDDAAAAAALRAAAGEPALANVRQPVSLESHAMPTPKPPAGSPGASGSAASGSSTDTPTSPSGAAATPVGDLCGEGGTAHTHGVHHSLVRKASDRNLPAHKVSLDLQRLRAPGSEADPDAVHAATDDASGFFDPPILRPIPRLFGAGEVTGGVHGGNRLAGNSLLECVVFGRIAGERAAAVALAAQPALKADAYTPLAFRESHKIAPFVYLFRFNLPSPLQTSGLAAGQYVSVRAVVNGETIDRFYSPISRADTVGHLDLLLKIDPSGGLMSHHLNALVPGDTLEFKGPLGELKVDLAPGGVLGRPGVGRLCLIAGGTGISPMCQIMREVFYHERDDVPVRMLYGAATPDQLAYTALLRHKAALHPNFTLITTVDKVPAGAAWDGRVGFMDAGFLRDHLFPPAPDVLVVLCGPWGMCKAVKAALEGLGYTKDMVYSYM